MRFRDNDRKATIRARRLRRDQTPPEGVLWSKLRNRGIGYKFRRQHPIEGYVLDFYCDEARLGVEIDGKDAHAGRGAYDAARDERIARCGVRVIRFAAVDVSRNLEGVLLTIVDACRERVGERGAER
jgi:very-short-patch-repair endonuclease